MNKTFSDPELYKRLLRPFPSKESADDSYNKFLIEFRELREKYGIPDIVMIARTIYMDNDEKVDDLITINCGDNNLIFPMIATAYDSQKARLLEQFGAFTIPYSILYDDNFFSTYLIYTGALKTKKEADVLIGLGDVIVDGVPIKKDGPAPEQNFSLTFRGETVKISGRKKK